MLEDSDYFSQSVDQGPSCLIIVLCPQRKLSTGRWSVWLPGGDGERSGSPAAGAPRGHTASLSSRPGWGLPPRGPRATPRSAAAAAILQKAPPFPGRGGLHHLLGEAASSKAGRGGPGTRSRWRGRLGDLLPPPLSLSLNLEKMHVRAQKNRWRAPRH